MITLILSIISGLFSAAGKLFEFMYAQKLVDAGKTAQKLDDLKGQIDAAKTAVLLREKARRAAELDPAGVMSDDEFVRPDDK
jgi:uncharacterized protein (DUF3084 family)